MDKRAESDLKMVSGVKLKMEEYAAVLALSFLIEAVDIEPKDFAETAGISIEAFITMANRARELNEVIQEGLKKDLYVYLAEALGANG